jgi:UDP-N-acetyl-D-glucosamine dehydrogenase
MKEFEQLEKIENPTTINILEKIKNGKARTAVIGLGYVGLPLLCEFAKAGFEATGIDIDEVKVNNVNSGKSYINDISEQELAYIIKNYDLQATTDYSVLENMDIISICVPTPLRKSKNPDISFIVATCSKVAKYLHQGQLIILESTTYPGTTEEIVLPILKRQFKEDEYTEICAGKVLAESHRLLLETQTDGDGELYDKSRELKVGEDFFLAFSPERVDPGNPRFKTKDIPKVIGGITRACCAVSTDFYKKIFPKVVTVSSTQSAEMVKLLENTFRSVNIALANEMSLMCDSLNVDVWEIIEAAGTKPFGFMPFYPGPGLGGHCIPIDPLYLTWKVRMKGFEPKFVELANEFNQQMPKKIVRRLQDRLNEAGKSLKNSKILVMGVAYKKDVSDTRESPAIEIVKLLIKKGGEVIYHDPYVPELKDIENDMQLVSVKYTPDNIKKVDCAVITTDHTDIDYGILKDNCRIIVDTRNALKNRAGKRM